MTETPALYDALTRPFDTAHRVPIGGGGDAPYLTGEQVTTRLNDVFTPIGWDFVLDAHGMNAEADEIWALGRLTVRHGGTEVVRMQFGSNKIKRNRQTGQPLDIGFDLKGAGTDALKKCATLVGIGLDLTAKGETVSARAPGAAPTLDWTAFWSTLKVHGLGPDDVMQRLGAPAAVLVQRGTPLSGLLALLVPTTGNNV